MSTLAEIQSKTKLYADARSALGAVIDDINAQVEAVKRGRMAEIRRLVARAAEHHDALKNMIGASPDLFIKPRTVVFDGIKVGFRKGTGSIEFDEEERVVELVEKHFGDRADELIRVKKKLDKKALAQLTVAELKKIGCTAEETGDEVVIKPTDSAVDKIVAALLKDATGEERA